MTEALNEEQVSKILRGITVPPQPQVIVDIHMEQAMPNPDIDRIAKLISQDVGLAGTILKVVNSDLFGLKNKITSIEQGVHILGLKSIISLSEALSMKSELDNEAIVALSGFWDSAMDIASVCATIARQIGYQAPDQAYCLGLFHNCGVPLLLKAYPNYRDVMQASYNGGTGRIIDIENQELRTNHAVVGYYVAKSWCLPQHLSEVIAEHHNAPEIFRPDGTPYNGHKKTLLAILKMAEHICGVYKTLGGKDVDHEWESIQNDLLEFIGLSIIDYEDIKGDVEGMGISSANAYYGS